MSDYKNILICTDSSEHANTAFVHAVDWAKKDNAKLHIFNVIMPDDPCGNLVAKRSSDSGDAEYSAANGEDVIQQTIGALKQKYKDSLNADLTDFEFVVKSRYAGCRNYQVCQTEQSRHDHTGCPWNT